MNTKSVILIFLGLSIAWLSSCQKDSANTPLSEQDQKALLFMLEEEKLARDTYMYLDSLWPNMPFGNIIQSEQSHMNAVLSLLDQNKVPYTILPRGQFADTTLQAYYNQFVAQGAQSLVDALKIGATIEDLDIVDLKEYTSQTTNADVIRVFSFLECGSRNHLRAFYKSIVLQNATYAPQFLTQEEFDAIINSAQEKCGQNY